jgi:hypothetical protein
LSNSCTTNQSAGQDAVGPEKIAEKVKETQQVMLKELQGTCDQISDHVHKISFNFYKSFDT